MFIDTKDTIIKAVMNTEHFTRILRTTLHSYVCSYTVLWAHSPVAAWTQYLTHRCIILLWYTLVIHLRSASITLSPLYAYIASLVATRLCHWTPGCCFATIALSSHAVRCLLYKSYCMPENFYMTMDKPFRTFTLSQLLIWKCLV
jgi:hypothetical protein